MAVDQRVLEIVIKAKNMATKGLKDAAKDLDGFGKVGMAGAAITGAGVAGAVALNKAADAAAGYGKQVLTVQRLTGASAEESSKWAAILGRFGVDATAAGRIFKTLDQQIAMTDDKYKKVTKTWKDAQGHVHKTTQMVLTNKSALHEMGIATQDASGKNRSALDVLGDVADYYSKAKDKTEATALASKVLGKGYMSLLPILSSGKAGIAELAAKAKEMGLVLTQDNIGAVSKYSEVLKDNKMAQQGMTVQMGLMVLPLKTMAENYLAKLFGWFNGLSPTTKKWVQYIAVGAVALALIIGPLLMLIGFLPMLAGGLGIVGGAFSAEGIAAATAWLATLGPVILVIAAIALVAAGVYLVIKNWNRLGPFFGKLWAGIVQGAKAGWKFLTAVWNNVVGSFKLGIDRLVGFFKSLPGRILGFLRELVSVITRPIQDAWNLLQKLNPFARHSPSLVDNVLAGAQVIARAYNGLNTLSVPVPTMTAAYSMAGAGSVTQRHETRVYLDGRELSRSLGQTVTHSSRSGAR